MVLASATVLYWRRTTRGGIVAGILVPQVVYVGFNFLPEVPLGPVTLFTDSYFGWGVSIYCMILGLLVTVVVSAVTVRSPDEDTDLYFEGLSAD
ncbi:hypothetical protein KY092_10865 [Natronomonas gomsonensis]|uniref:hypothetical protein n=1 Tax=Natronomonas gomsonensis TaxID=1046043 RepID=UPI0020CA42F7|nr:hypothetical protein [Natronomonas gomsonensis]MCY4731055.1 hypothetical protein [Natronomonas gomsonensis]